MNIPSPEKRNSLEQRLDDALLALELNPKSKSIAATVERLRKAAASARTDLPQNGCNARINLGLATLPDLLKAINDRSKRTREAAWKALDRDHPDVAKKVKKELLMKKAVVAGVIILLALCGLGWYLLVARPAQEKAAKEAAIQQQVAAQRAAEEKAKVDAEAARLAEENRQADELAVQNVAQEKVRQELEAKQAAAAKAKADAEAARTAEEVARQVVVAQNILENLKKAAEGGNPDAQHKLGLKYASGDGIPTDRVEAYMWLHRAVEQDHTQALLDRYELGKTMTQSAIEEAKRRAKSKMSHR